MEINHSYNVFMPSDRTISATRREWRELGFFYDRDDDAKVWKITGSRAGLLKFRDALLEYVASPLRASNSEHQHYGPYMFLEIMTWPEPSFDQHAIRGPLADLSRLAKLVEDKLNFSHANSEIFIKEEFAVNSPYALILDLREDGFDPASPDPNMDDTVHNAIVAAEQILPGHAAPDGEEDPRWQVILKIGDFVEEEAEAIWPFALKWGSHEDADLRAAIATCLLEHLLGHHFDLIFPRVEAAARSNVLFADTTAMCWKVDEAKETTRAERFDRLIHEIRSKS
jgi:hypothetical protein